jgi:hypothetical protein
LKLWPAISACSAVARKALPRERAQAPWVEARRAAAAMTSMRLRLTTSPQPAVVADPKSPTKTFLSELAQPFWAVRDDPQIKPESAI